jgi:hypothetical protein
MKPRSNTNTAIKKKRKEKKHCYVLTSIPSKIQDLLPQGWEGNLVVQHFLAHTGPGFHTQYLKTTKKDYYYSI